LPIIITVRAIIFLFLFNMTGYIDIRWKIFAACCLLLLIFSCEERKVVGVTRVGELEDLIRDGKLGANASLNELTGTPHLYAIGNVTGNEGFITVLDGKCYISVVDTAKKLTIDSSCTATATLLLYSNVGKWKEYEIPADVITWKQLEQFIGNMATKYNVSRTDAFCFRLTGHVDSLNWHVLKWREGMKEITYKKMHTLGLNGVLTDKAIDAIGFYSKDPREIFVHQETVINVHFISVDHTIAGRIEDMRLDGRMKLYLPDEGPE
jgi:hypothetical protein